jgi:hypothetical protein
MNIIRKLLNSQSNVPHYYGYKIRPFGELKISLSIVPHFQTPF